MSHDYIILKSGKKFYFLNPKPDQFTIEDLTWSLSRIARFLGHTKGAPYPVLQHLCICHDLAPEHCKKESLGHDLPEAVMGDVVSPLKSLLPSYKVLERNTEKIFAKKFNWKYPFHKDVKKIDLIALATEIKCLTDRTDYKNLPYQPANIIITPWSPEKARQEFMKRWKLYYK